MPKLNLIAAFLICAFVIDRLVSAIYFVASYRNQTERTENNRKIVRFLIAGAFAAAAVIAFDFLRILKEVWPSKPAIDALVTWFVLVAGADQLSSLLGVDGAESSAGGGEQTLHVSGTLQLDAEGEKVLRLQRS